MEIQKSITILKALADPSRLKIVNALFERPQYVEELAQRLGLAVSTVSHHLKKLEAAGLIGRRKEQYYVVYFVREEVFDASIGSLVCFRNQEAGVQEQRLQDYRKKIITAFFEGSRLKRLPAQYKKRLVVLEELAKRFEPGVKYNEPEIDALIQNAYEDHCTVRREMADNGILKRKDGVYWLPDSRDAASPGISKRKRKMDKRKALKREYMEAFRAPGICKITNSANNKVFLAGSLNVEALVRRHRSELKLGSHRNEELLKDYKEFGAEAFRFEILESIEQSKEADFDYTREVEILLDLWLEKLQPYGDKGYNRPPKAR